MGDTIVIRRASLLQVLVDVQQPQISTDLVGTIECLGNTSLVGGEATRTSGGRDRDDRERGGVLNRLDSLVDSSWDLSHDGLEHTLEIVDGGSCGCRRLVDMGRRVVEVEWLGFEGQVEVVSGLVWHR